MVGSLVRALLVASVVFIAACGSSPAKDGSGEPPVVHAIELERLRGGWTGTFEYFDAATSTSSTMRAVASGTLARASRREKGWTLHVEYPEKPGNGQELDFSIAEAGHVVGGARVVEKRVVPRGPLKLVLEERGTDGRDAKPATIRQVLEVDGNSLTFAKFVKPDGQKKFVLRAQYTLAR